MRKDITKKFLWKENRDFSKMISKAIVDFIFRKKINIDENQISYDIVEFRNVFSTEFTDLNTNNFSKSGYMFKEFVRKNGETIGFNMIYCESGKFEMGSNDPSDENPKRVVEIERPFLLGETEVTQELYKFVMGYNPSVYKGDKYPHPNSSQRPVEMVTWYDAIMFCNKLSELLGKNLYYEIKDVRFDWNNMSNNIKEASVKINKGANGYRLPLEKEWEYAAKAETNNQWVGTNYESKLEEYAWFEKNADKQTHPVATKKPNEWGFYDMSGNVWEWCYDLDNNNLDECIRRGGSWYSNTSYLHSTFRSNNSPSYRTNVLGFRVAASL